MHRLRLNFKQKKRIFELHNDYIQRNEINLTRFCKYIQNELKLPKVPSRKMIRTILKADFSREIAKSQLRWKQRLRVKYPMMEYHLVMFIQFLSKRGIAINGHILRAQAQRILNHYDLQELNLSDGWLSKFLSRNGVSKKKMHGSEGSISIELFQDQVLKIQQKIMQYAPRSVYNMDETALFYQTNPTYTLSQETTKGLKSGKARLTVLLCCNLTGTEKFEPLIIGKAKAPRCFMGSNPEELGFQYYYHSAKAWMNREIFQNYMIRLNDFFKYRDEHALIILDNVKTHSQMELSHVEIFFLPPKSTCLLQPLDQGIIRDFKYWFQRYKMENILTQLETEMNPDYVLNQLQGMNLIKTAWEQVSEKTIRKCWVHSTLVRSDSIELQESAVV